MLRLVEIEEGQGLVLEFDGGFDVAVEESFDLGLEAFAGGRVEGEEFFARKSCADSSKAKD